MSIFAPGSRSARNAKGVACVLAGLVAVGGCNALLNNSEGRLAADGGQGGTGAGGGGSSGTGAAPGSGGAAGLGGATGSGGGSGGNDGSSGAAGSTGGSVGTGGTAGMGGTSGNGGTSGTGGSTGTGGVARDASADAAGGSRSNDGGVDAAVDAGPCGVGRKLCAGVCRAITDPMFGCAAIDCSPCPPLLHAAPACVQGACGAACMTGWGDCVVATPGCETSLRSSPNCGNCNVPCGNPQVCGYESMHCYDPRWADWAMPNSRPFITLPDGGMQPLPNQRSYDTTSIQGVVIDNVTHLHWQRAVDVAGGDGMGHYDWQAANAYCATLVLDGGPGLWRVPTRIDLLSIVDTSVDTSGGAAPINAAAFPNTPAESFWTSSLVPSNTSLAWEINFNNQGYANNGDPISSMDRVRCVR